MPRSHFASRGNSSTVAVQRALRALAERADEQRSLIFTIPDSPDTRRFPVDDDYPIDDKFESYLVKEMEFAETFLVASRLQKELGLQVEPLSFPVEEYIQAILLCVGREAADSRITPLKYYPAPHLMTLAEIPFVDFAGLLTVVMSDFILWQGSPDDPISKSARAEMETALGFLLGENTPISDSKGLGWAFIPGDKCQTRVQPLAAHREALPTAWVLTAIQKYLSHGDPDPKLKARIEAVLPDVFRWIHSLERERGLHASTERPSRVNLAGHNYVTEALLTLAELEVDAANEPAVEAIRNFLDELDRPDARTDFEMNINYPIKTRPEMIYQDRTTWANCLATLAVGVDHLKRVGGDAELRRRAQFHCAEMARYITLERVNRETGLWQNSTLQFHWVLTAVEALLRVSLFAQTRTYLTTDEAVTQAVELVLDDAAFMKAFREALLTAVQNTSKRYEADESGDSTEA